MIPVFIISILFSSFASAEMNCEATYNNIGVTYQNVKSLDQYYYCFGYHHGKDRAWQMDYFRRVAQGRNAEVYGYSSLKSDLMMRLLDLPSLASKLYQGLPSENKNWLAAYSAGANKGFIEGKDAKELKDLNIVPEPWTPEDSILVLVLQSFDQTRKTFFRDYEEEKSKEHWKEKAVELFNEDDAPWFNTILKEGEYPKNTGVSKTSYIPSKKPALWENFPEVFGKESGSNNWVVSKNKSKNGYAMLANDPHLDLKTPLFWYWMSFKTPDFNIIGGSLPGVPVIISGTNGNVAWGLTNAYINTADAVFLKDYPKDYFVSFRPKVDVKLGFLKLPFIFKTFEKTIDGDPVLPLDIDNNAKMVLRWTGFKMKSHHLVPMFNLMKAKNVTQMDDALKQVGVPAWNFVFADQKGDIGYRVVGEAFREHKIDEYGISTETPEEFRIKELLHPMERPHVLKPKREYIYSANNRHWPKNSKFYGGRGYTLSFRGYRIDELLKIGKHDLDSFKRIQCDRQAVDAQFFVPKILKLVKIPEFKNWNYYTSNDSIAPSLYRRLMDLLMEGWQVNEHALFKLLDHPSETQIKELNSFSTVARNQISGRSWGQVHKLTFAHLSKNADWKFSPEIEGIGDNHSVDPGTSKWDPDKKNYEQFSGASMRMIILMKPIPEIYLSLPGYNRNYTQHQPNTPSWKEWKACEYNQVKF